MTEEGQEHEARYWEKQPDGRIHCLLCPVGCVIADGKKGVCLGRSNRDGTLYAVNYGQVVSVGMDPIEKKPLYNFYPGRSILSIGPNGCNLRCKFCQNWQISQTEVPTRYISPEQLLKLAEQYESLGVSYTYTEPMIWFEYFMDAGALLKEHGYKNVFVTNGTINPDPLKEMLPLIDAMNIDIKSMDPGFYDKLCHGHLDATLRTAKMARESGCHLEITNLIITNQNDDPEQLKKLAKWIVENLGPQTPLHFSKYFPAYELEEPPTKEETVHRAREIAVEVGLRNVYVGNLGPGESNDSGCQNCGELLVRRRGYSVDPVGLRSPGVCAKCGGEVDFVL
jgi:pyruvate formate lyase activating enzyme